MIAEAQSLIKDKSVLVEDTGCWEWRSSNLPKGYGMVQFNKKRYYTHRLSYEAFIGPIESGMLICHKCDNPKCCNPDHLFMGTAFDNMRDMAAKGRNWVPYGAWAGQANPKAKLTPEIRSKIEDELRSGERAAYVAQRHSITAVRVGQIRKEIGLPPVSIGRPKGSKNKPKA